MGLIISRQSLDRTQRQKLCERRILSFFLSFFFTFLRSISLSESKANDKTVLGNT